MALKAASSRAPSPAIENGLVPSSTSASRAKAACSTQGIRSAAKTRLALKVGDEVEVFVDRVENC
jgi:hypothetical protein